MIIIQDFEVKRFYFFMKYMFHDLSAWFEANQVLFTIHLFASHLNQFTNIKASATKRLHLIISNTDGAHQLCRRCISKKRPESKLYNRASRTHLHSVIVICHQSFTHNLKPIRYQLNNLEKLFRIIQNFLTYQTHQTQPYHPWVTCPTYLYTIICSQLGDTQGIG